LTREKGWCTQFYGWSPDGQTAVLLRGWESEANGKWEEEHKQFHYRADGWLVDGYLLDLASGKATNVTGLERVSHFNEGLGFMPRDPTKLRFSATIDGKTRPYLMDLDGKNKRALLGWPSDC
jgi:Tol biopolymer transport system component